MRDVLGFISSYGSVFIIILAVFVLIRLIMLWVKLSVHQSHIEDALNSKRNLRTTINKKTHEISDETEEGEAVTPDTIRDYEKNFNQTCSKYEIYTQLIPLFPLFGILGTVAGLMLVVQQGDEAAIENLVDGLGTALSTTFYGLVSAIVLKTVATLLPAKTIYDTDIMLSDYNKKLDNAIKLNNISEE